MSAQSWSVKGIDPKVREAVREAAARQGMSLGEYLNQALQKQREQEGGGQTAQRAPVRARPLRAPQAADDLDDWLLSAPTDMAPSDPGRAGQRLDAVERRTQLAVTGLDRAVSAIDRSVLGLASRVEEAEATARESADRVSEALEQFRAASDILAGERDALGDISALRSQAAAAEEVARNLANELQQRDAALVQRIDELDRETKHAATTSLAMARQAAEAAAREAATSSSGALEQIRELQAAFARRLNENEADTRRNVQAAIEQAQRAHETLAARLASVESNGQFGAVEGLDDLRAVQTALSQRLEKVEQGGREATAGLRQAAGSAIADLRNSLLGVSARLKLMEERGGGNIDVSDLRATQAALNERLARLETQGGRADPEIADRLSRLERAHDALEPEVHARLEQIEARVGEPSTDVNEALARFEARLQSMSAGSSDDALHARVDEIWSKFAAQETQTAEAQTATRTLETSLQRLAERIAESESTANQAIRTLEETVSGLGAQVAANDAQKETDALRAMLEQRLDDMARNVTDMVAEARSELIEKAQQAETSAALGAEQVNGLEEALADVNRRLAAAERRQAQTIEAISVEIKRMSETVDRRLRAVETREGTGEGSGDAVREEVARLAKTLEGRFEEIERREAAAFDRMGIEVGRLSERLEERFASVEGRSAQAIEQVGEQVARMAERFNQRQDALARDLNDRLANSEDRTSQRVSDAIAGMMHRLSEVEDASVHAVTPVARAVSSVASRLQALEDHEDEDGDIPTPARRQEDSSSAIAAAAAAPLFGDLEVESEPPSVEEEAAPPPFSLDTMDDEDEDAAAYFDLPEDDDEPPPAIVAAAQTTEPAPPPVVVPPPILTAPPLAAAPAFSEPPVRAAPITPASATPLKSIDADAFLDDDLSLTPSLIDEDDDLWSPPDEAVIESAPATALAATDEIIAPAGDAIPEKGDYLANARRAAQTANAKPAKKEKPAKEAKPVKEAKAKPAKEPSLRGRNRVLFWSTASLGVLALVAGAYMTLNQQGETTVETTPEPVAPEAFEPTPVQAAPLAPAATDPAVPPTDAAATPAEGAPVSAAPAPADAQAAAGTRPPGAASQAAAVAEPLPPRAVSLDQAAARGDAVAQYELGLQRLAANRSGDGVTLLRQSANQGLAMAQYRLAKLYERGEGVQADLAQARAWTERAAAAGNRRAMHDLGVYFARGEGAPLDEAAAFRWFRQAAELGVADSQFNLGVLYQQGRGVGANPSEALFWYLVAARQGDADAGARATQLEGTLQTIQVEQARARAQAFRPRAASARANGEFGPRPWAVGPAAPARR